MNRIESSIEIRYPVEAGFAFVADGRHNPEWQGAFQEAKDMAQNPGSGIAPCWF